MDINQSRLSNQLLTNPKPTVYEIVKHMACIQSQEFKQSQRAIASRGLDISQQDIYNAYNSWQIVRTWTQRGTIHTVATEDAWWILQLCASKTLAWFARRRENLWISDDINKALDIIKTNLKWRSMNRADIVQKIKDNGIDIQTWRAYHIICYAATLWIIARWPIVNDEQEYILLDDWVKNPRDLSGDEALAELTLRYFVSHGPATIQDFARWSGLWVTQIRKWLELCGDKLYIYQRDGLTYYHWEISQDIPKQNKEWIFLAWFDEFLLWYKDRTDTLHIDHHTLVDPARNGIFKPTVIIDGIHIATRSTKSTKKQNIIYIKPFENISNQEIEILKKWIYKYSKFTNIDWEIEIL